MKPKKNIPFNVESAFSNALELTKTTDINHRY